MDEHAYAPRRGSSPERAAGTGAAQQVDVLERRLSEKQAQLAGLQREISGIEQSLLRWKTGLEGERRVGGLLDGLAPAGWVALHDLHWPGRAKANLDHVVVGPGGILVIDAKNWTAQASVDAEGVLSIGGNRRALLSHDTAAMVAAVAAVVAPEHRTAVAGALCFVKQPLPPALTKDGVVVLGDGQLTEWLSMLRPRFAPDEVRGIAEHLRRHLGGPVSPPLLRTASPSLRRRGAASAAVASSPSSRRRSRTGRKGGSRRASTRPPKVVLLVVVLACLLSGPQLLHTFGGALNGLLSGLIVDITPESTAMTPATVPPQRDTDPVVSGVAP